MSTKLFKPFYNVKPGETITETIECLGLTKKEIADEAGITEEMLTQIIEAERPITQVVAETLHLVTGVSTKFWLNLEANYQAGLANSN